MPFADKKLDLGEGCYLAPAVLQRRNKEFRQDDLRRAPSQYAFALVADHPLDSRSYETDPLFHGFGFLFCF
jgi:hypothetical protein